MSDSKGGGAANEASAIKAANAVVKNMKEHVQEHRAKGYHLNCLSCDHISECDECGVSDAVQYDPPATVLDDTGDIPTMIRAQLPTEALDIWFNAYNNAALVGASQWRCEQAGWTAVDAAGFAPESLPKYVKVSEGLQEDLQFIREVKGSDGRTFEVVLITAGDSLNQRRYSESLLRKAAPMFEGARAFADHPTKDEWAQRSGNRSVKELVGWYDGVQFKKKRASRASSDCSTSWRTRSGCGTCCATWYRAALRNSWGSASTPRVRPKESVRAIES